MADEQKKPEAEQAAKPTEQSQKQGRGGKPVPTPDAMFRKHRVLPDAKTIFSHAIPPLADVKDDCIVVPDASVLLAPYQEIGKATLNEIKTTYETLIRQKRFIIPGQVAREFASSRPRLIGEVINTLSKFAGMLKLQCGDEKPELPILQHAAENDAFNQAWSDATKSLGGLRQSVAMVVDAVKSWALNDPISLMYRELFKSEFILDSPVDEQKLPAELGRRFDHKIPPGYIDEGKDDGGVGDYLIWLTILEIGQTRKQPVLFVTGEKKADWFHGSIEGPFSPRFELLEEFRQASGGQGFYAAPLHVALQLFGVSDEESIDQVKRSEEKTSLQISLFGDVLQHSVSTREDIKYRLLKVKKLHRYVTHRESQWRQAFSAASYDESRSILRATATGVKSRIANMPELQIVMSLANSLRDAGSTEYADYVYSTCEEKINSIFRELQSVLEIILSQLVRSF